MEKINKITVIVDKKLNEAINKKLNMEMKEEFMVELSEEVDTFESLSTQDFLRFNILPFDDCVYKLKVNNLPQGYEYRLKINGMATKNISNNGEMSIEDIEVQYDSSLSIGDNSGIFGIFIKLTNELSHDGKILNEIEKHGIINMKPNTYVGFTRINAVEIEFVNPEMGIISDADFNNFVQNLTYTSYTFKPRIILMDINKYKLNNLNDSVANVTFIL